MLNRKLSLSDGGLDRGGLDVVDGHHPKLDTLQNHSHFFATGVSSARSYPIIRLDGLDVPRDVQQPGAGRNSPKAPHPNEPVFNFDNRQGLAHDMSFLASQPDLCDVTFLVGDDRQPVCGVKAILAARSKVFRRILYGDNSQLKKPKKKSLYRPSSDGFVDKNDFRGQPTYAVLDFEPEVFKQLMEYIHTGTVVLQSRTLLGLMNAADHYGLEELKIACVQFLDRAINTDTVCAMLSSAEKYIQYKSTKILVQKILDFVDQHAEVILNLGSFATLPQHVVRIILGREELLATEETKFEAAFRWCWRYIDDHPDMDMKTIFEPFVSRISFHEISANHLMKKVKPANIVDDEIILAALAYQANPKSLESQKYLAASNRSNLITTLDQSPPHIRRVRSSGTPIKIHVSSSDDDDEDSDSKSNSRQGRGNSVPPQTDLTDSARMFELRTDSQASELSLSSMTASSTSISSIPPSPPVVAMDRSTSASSHPEELSPANSDIKKYPAHTECYHVLSSTSVEV
jgi:hypothetical protein